MTTLLVRLETPEQQVVEVLEQQIVEAVTQLSDAAKQQILKRLIIGYDSWEPLYAVGESRIQALCRERGIDWDGLHEDERTDLIDRILH